MKSKDQIRSLVWKEMEEQGVSRFPGAEGRIPNFTGSKQAAELLAGHRLWKKSRVIRVNPDSPQAHARSLAFEDGKVVVISVPRLRDPHPFRLIDARKLSPKQRREASTIKGALKIGKVVAEEELPEIDFILCGSVAVNLDGARVGKGGGYLDLEYGLLTEAGKIDEHTVVATSVHPVQVRRQELPMVAHDLPVDLISTPQAVVDVSSNYPRPRGILWDHLQPPQIREIPILERMGYA